MGDEYLDGIMKKAKAMRDNVHAPAPPDVAPISDERLAEIKLHGAAWITEADVTAIRARIEAAEKAREWLHIGWLEHTKSGKRIFIDGTDDPREVHDNGRPYLRVFAEPAPPKETK